MHVAVHSLYIPAHPACRLANRQWAVAGEGTDQFQPFRRQKPEEKLRRVEADTRIFLIASLNAFTFAA
jgi:hypothetical protein